jgi:glycosyltransferase involved in cell wall biosynthesis
MKKKILIFSISYAPFWGGAEVAVKEITDRLDYQFDMITILVDKKLPRVERVGNINVYRINCPKILFPFFGFFKAIQLHKKNNYQMSWSIMTFAGFVGLFLKIFKPQVKFILTLQEGTSFSSIKLKSSLALPLLYLMFRKADIVQSISNFLADFAKSMGYKKQVVVIPNGVDLSRFSEEIDIAKKTEIENFLKKEKDDIFMITSSRLTYKNAVDDVIKAMPYIDPKVTFLVLGVGEDEKKLRCLARDLGVRERVKFLGFIDQKDLPIFLQISDIFIRPSTTGGVTALGFYGSGVGLTGTATALSIGGSAPAGNLTGTTLAAGVTGSSLTSIGTLVSGAVPASLVTAGTFGAGAYTFPSTLAVTSTLNASSTLNVTGAATFYSTLSSLTHTPAATLTSDLGSASLRWNNLYAGSIYATSSVITNGSSTGYTATNLYSTTANLATINSSTAINASGTLSATGATSLYGALNAFGAVNASSTLGVTGATTLYSTLNVRATSTLATTTATTLAVTGELNALGGYDNTSMKQLQTLMSKSTNGTLGTFSGQRAR